MMNRDLKSHLTPGLLVAPAVLAADSTPVAIDVSGHHSALIQIYVGIGGITFSAANKIEFVLSHGDSATAGEHTPVTLNDVDGVAAADISSGALTGGIIKSFKAAHAAAAFYQFNYLGDKTHISLLADFSGTHGTGTPIYAAAILGGKRFTANIAEADLKTGRNA